MADQIDAGADGARAVNARRNRLPTLAEVLARRTKPPVDLYCYYLFLQREGAEDSLDFWLDVQQHENLCRAYFKDMRKSGRSVREEWPQYWELARNRGSIYNRINGIDGPDGAMRPLEAEKNPFQQGDDYALRHEANGSPRTDSGERPPSHPASPSPSSPRLSNDHMLPRAGSRSPSPGPEASGAARRFSRPTSPLIEAPTEREQRRSYIAKRASHAPTIINRDTAITRTDLIASAERIYARYLLPGSEKEIYLPSQLRINSFPISSQALPQPTSPEYDVESLALAQVPDMFHQQKEYVFRTMESDAYPRFLRAKAFGNITPISALVRLSLGLLALWAGMSTAFAFVLLDTKPRSKRLWVILPFSFAILLILSHQYELDPILAFLGFSETMPFRTIRVKEPYVHRLLLFRAVWVSFASALIVAALTVLFVFVPGHRL